MSRRAAAALATVVIAGFGIVGTAPAGAAGGSGASECSIAGNPATSPNPGAMIRDHQPFGGIGNDGANPGFAGPGFSGCRPT